MDIAPTSVFLAPLFLLFEGLQLVAAEKLLGIKQIESGLVERDKVPGDTVAAFWSLGIIAEAAWCLWLLSNDVTRVHAGCVLLISLFGFSMRNSCKLKWVLVIMTIEGACRMGLMVSMLGSAWRNL
ncbi:MAG: hypothetical protein RIQ79_46 [Verrucomicrobiota bacterium]